MRRINTTPRAFAVINPNGPHGDNIVAGYLNEADATLYAAAPRMLAALQTLISKWDQDRGGPHQHVISGSVRQETIDEARAALSQATGER